MLFLSVLFVSVMFFNFKELHLIKYYSTKIERQKDYIEKLKQTYKQFLFVKNLIMQQKRFLDEVIKKGYDPRFFQIYPFDLEKDLSREEIKSIINVLSLTSGTIFYKPDKLKVEPLYLKEKNRKDLKDKFKVVIRGSFIVKVEQ